MSTATPAPAFTRILVAVDGSEHGVQAARVAGALARALVAHLTILTVYHAPSKDLGEPAYSRALNKVLDDSRDIAEEARSAVLASGGPEADVRWLWGSPAETIIHCARDAEHDLVVMGTHGRGRIGSALLGSVSQEVASHAGRPVVVVGLDDS
jgi:nucleotide-binding universal stress UspA family protein